MIPPPGRALAPILWQNIEYYREFVDIVEWPSVGTLAIPEGITQILDEGTSVMLNYCLIHHAKMVHVRCVRSKPSELKLEVTAKYMHSTMAGRYPLMELSLWARRFDGKFAYGGNVRSDDTATNFFMRLLLPTTP